MIKLNQVKHKSREGHISYALPGGQLVSRPHAAIDALNEVDMLIERLEQAIARRRVRTITKSGAVIERKLSDDDTYFLGA